MHPQVVELLVQLLFHECSLFPDPVLHAIAIEVCNVQRSNFVLRAANVFSHLLDLFKFFEQLVCQLSCLKDLISRVQADLLQLMLR